MLWNALVEVRQEGAIGLFTPEIIQVEGDNEQDARNEVLLEARRRGLEPRFILKCTARPCQCVEVGSCPLCGGKEV